MMRNEDSKKWTRSRKLLRSVLIAAALVAAGIGLFLGHGGNGVRQLERGKDALRRESKKEEAPRQNDQNTEKSVPEGERGGIVLSPEEKANIGLNVEEAAARSLEEIRTVNGKVRAHPDKVALVTSRVAGKAVGVHVKLGDPVRKGQDLADIQSVELEKVELELIQAENKLILAKTEFVRLKTLVEKGIAAKKELNAAENQYNAVLNEIDGLVRQLVLLGLKEEDVKKVRREKIVTTLHLRAPIAGTIVERDVVLGQTVEPNANLFRILDSSTMIVEGEAFEDILGLLKKGQTVRVTVAAYPEEFFSGKIVFIHPTVEPEKRTVHFWVEVDNSREMLKEGFFARLIVVVSEGKNVLTVPTAALMSEKGEDFVFVEKNGGFVRADVSVGTRTERYVEVKRGVKPGDRIITDGKQQVYAKYLSARRGEPVLGGHPH